MTISVYPPFARPPTLSLLARFVLAISPHVEAEPAGFCVEGRGGGFVLTICVFAAASFDLRGSTLGRLLSTIIPGIVMVCAVGVGVCKTRGRERRAGQPRPYMDWGGCGHGLT